MMMQAQLSEIQTVKLVPPLYLGDRDPNLVTYKEGRDDEHLPASAATTKAGTPSTTPRRRHFSSPSATGKTPDPTLLSLSGAAQVCSGIVNNSATPGIAVHCRNQWRNIWPIGRDFQTV
jgi:hypothetical protein